MADRFGPRETLNLLIFDMDGVLIDVSNSYRETIAQTVHRYLELCFDFTSKRITQTDLSLFKSAGGFNNDWDLTSGWLHYLLSLSTLPPRPRRKPFSGVREAILDLREASSAFRPSAIAPPHKNHLEDFLRNVHNQGGGLKGIRRALDHSWEGWVYGEGDLDRGNVVKRIFQETYLGQQFVSFYRLPRLFYKGKGFYLRERPLFPRKILSALRKKVRLGIASGRPRFEAELALKRFHLLPYFDSVITLDESEEEEMRLFRKTGKKVRRSKPHPYPLLRAAQASGLSCPRCAYIGDVVDDMQAARAARKELPMLALGFLSAPAKQKGRKEILIKAGADRVIETPQDLLRLVDRLSSGKAGDLS